MRITKHKIETMLTLPKDKQQEYLGLPMPKATNSAKSAKKRCVGCGNKAEAFKAKTSGK